MASGEHVVIDTDVAPGLGATGVVIAPPGEDIRMRVARNVLGFALVAAVVSFATYLVLASTVFVFLGAGEHKVAVLRNAFPIGQAPEGAVVYASAQPVRTGVVPAVGQTFGGVPGGQVVQIVAGPTGAVATNAEGNLTVDGTDTGYTGNTKPHNLTREYLAICITGACKPGQPVLIVQNSIVGEAKGYLGFTGLSDIKTPKADNK